MYRDYEKKYRKYVELGYIKPYTHDNEYHLQGDVVKCFFCKSNNIKIDNIYHIEHIPCEYDYVCMDCGEKLGHRAYGRCEYHYKFKIKDKKKR